MDIAKAFKKIKIVYQEYKSIVPPYNEKEMLIGRLQSVVEKYSGCKINFKQVDWNPVQIKGRIDRYENYADIVVSSKLNYCWRRFVSVKEMCHLIIDTEDGLVDYSTAADSKEKLQKLINDLIAPSGAGANSASDPCSDQWVSDTLAQFCAAELMFPIADRDIAHGLVNEGKETILSLATSYRVPARYVEMSLSPLGMNLFGSFARKAEQELDSIM